MKIYEDLSLKNIEGEIWKDIKGYSGDYQISNYGRVKSFKKWHGTDVRILKQIEDKDGYFYVRLFNNKYKNKYIHHLVYKTFYKKANKNEIIHHIDENPKNNHLLNLKLMDKIEHNSFHKSGERSKHSVLTEQNVWDIKKSLKFKLYTIKQLSWMFGVDHRTISYIKNGKNWKRINQG